MQPLPRTRSRWLSRSQGPCHGKDFANWKRVKDLCLPGMTLGPCVVDSLHFGVGQVVLLKVVALFHPRGRRERPSWNHFFSSWCLCLKIELYSPSKLLGIHCQLVPLANINLGWGVIGMLFNESFQILDFDPSHTSCWEFHYGWTNSMW